MANEFSVSTEITRAIGFRSVQERSKALRSVIETLSETEPNGPASLPLCGDAISISHDQALAHIYDNLCRSAGGIPLNELDMITFASNGQMDHITCAFSSMTGLPADRIELAFTGRRPDLLLIVCRTLNFAWSTVILVLRLRKYPPSIAAQEILCDEYHGIAILQAQRFIRFLNVHVSKAAF